MVPKSVFVTLVLVSIGIVLATEPPCPKPPARCPRTWTYNPATPWGKTCAGWATCSNGQQQSPIDLSFPPALAGSCRAPKFNIQYKALSDVFIFNTGNKFVFPVYRTDMMTFDYNGVRYFLTSVEFHAPSEHLHDGKRYNMEMQLIHTSGNTNRRTLAVSIFFDIGNCLVNCTQTNQFLDQIQYNLPQFPGASCGNGRVENLLGYFREECDNGPRNSNNSSDPNCCRLDCTWARCGDGVKDTTEQCDDGAKNANKPGACRTNCRLPACGDGIVDPREECDDGNINNKDGCSSICKKECGDAFVNSPIEECDTGVNNSDTIPDRCRSNCKNAWCGDGVVDQAEQCDSGALNGIAPNQCRPQTCRNFTCGDGITDLNEECDDGLTGALPNGQNNRCSLNCTLNCGNGRRDNGEECDDGGFNSNSPDSNCRTSCTLHKCGDGIIDPLYGEQCDSGLESGNIWCSPTCIQLCGNTVVEGAEECDHGCANSDAPDAPCRPNCKLPRCGDGIVDRNEMCDLGDANSNAPNAACRRDCSVRRCGDGVRDSDEECDNGVNTQGSGCFMCRTECGNGHLEGTEECDFGQFNSDTVPDCCRKTCKMPNCGDGTLDSREECDTGRNNSDVTPNACRTNCRFAYCGDGVIDPNNGEQCDNGADNSDTAVDGCSSDCILNSFRQARVKGRNVVDLNLAIPNNHDSLAYQGSLTAPPCTEGVQWIVFNQVQKMTRHQFERFTKAPFGIYNNVRPAQKLCNRRITRALKTPVPVCGNGILEGNEQCDMGLKNTLLEPNRCRQNCLIPFKGDGITDSGEECDDGPAGSARCTNTFKFRTSCTNPFVCPIWSYKDSCKWGFLCSAWETCNSERANSKQSPVNLQIAPALGRGKFSLHYTYSNINTITLINSGRSVALMNDNQLNMIQGPNGASYILQYIKFHSPSEHTINGQHADLEAQFFHQAADQSITVVSVLFNKGASNSFLDQFFFYLPRDTDCRCGNGVRDAGEACDNGDRNSNTRPGQCRLNCQLPGCGDGVVDRGEQCDNGILNSNTADRCRTSCKLPTCGDNIVDSGEQCDPPGPTCSSSCMLLCGNNIIDAAASGEVCDNGAANSDSQPNSCRTNCQPARCGDGVVDDLEECDDGALLNSNTRPNACRANCKLPVCGDGIADFAQGEECDLGVSNSESNSCNTLCQLTCGNALPNQLEECDTGYDNFNSDNNCRTNCKSPKCGDFIYDPSHNEECDDGPTGSTWCTSDCKLRCGDGRIDVGEGCDDGALNSDTTPNACRTDCTLPSCGDGVRDANEMCDFGPQNSDGPNSPCRTTCVLPRCGDRIVDAVEECDDGNSANGDGCSSTCRKECGNGRRDGNEVCDDGNTVATPNTCRPRGYKYGECVKPRCGDGIVDDGEQCDNGELNSDTTPNACRTTCTLPTPSDGIVDDCYGERCDAGANNNRDFTLQPGSCSATNIPNSCRTFSTSFSAVSLHNAFDRTSPVLTYSGSLTNPPCTEGVTYMVFQKIASLSEKQLNLLRKVLPTGNSRGVQPLNGRPVAFTATYDTVCGDGIVEKTEECDDGDYNANAPNKCRKNCKKPACGDGILDAGEQCDNGARNSANGPCGANCRWAGTPATASCPANGSTTCSTSPTTTINVIFANLLKGAQCATGKCN